MGDAHSSTQELGIRFVCNCMHVIRGSCAVLSDFCKEPHRLTFVQKVVKMLSRLAGPVRRRRRGRRRRGSGRWRQPAKFSRRNWRSRSPSGRRPVRARRWSWPARRPLWRHPTRSEAPAIRMSSDWIEILTEKEGRRMEAIAGRAAMQTFHKGVPTHNRLEMSDSVPFSTKSMLILRRPHRRQQE